MNKNLDYIRPQMHQNKGNSTVLGPYICSYICLVCGGWGFKIIPQQRQDPPTIIFAFQSGEELETGCRITFRDDNTCHLSRGPSRLLANVVAFVDYAVFIDHFLCALSPSFPLPTRPRHNPSSKLFYLLWGKATTFASGALGSRGQEGLPSGKKKDLPLKMACKSWSV